MVVTLPHSLPWKRRAVYYLNCSIVEGDIFSSECATITVPVNCVGVMGKGLALSFKTYFPLLFQDYSNRCRKQEVKIGEPYLFRYKLPTGKSILVFPTKRHWTERTKIDYIRDGCQYMLDNPDKFHFTSLAIPALGCGLGQLEWNVMIRTTLPLLNKLGVPVHIYRPEEQKEKRTKKKEK